MVSGKSAKVKNETKKQKTEITISKFPKQIGFVNDFESIFTEDEIKFPENSLNYYRENSNRQIAIITRGSIPENMESEQYAIRISKHWNIG